ncbi:hypothetical protein M0802_007481 [Mischocyttarus mexicanus]|nr:hypothetical protein M0802_007481 [Mischocyttarus mexicanus]
MKGGKKKEQKKGNPERPEAVHRIKNPLENVSGRWAKTKKVKCLEAVAKGGCRGFETELRPSNLVVILVVVVTVLVNSSISNNSVMVIVVVVSIVVVGSICGSRSSVVVVVVVVVSICKSFRPYGSYE